MHCPFSESSRNRSLSMPLMQESYISWTYSIFYCQHYVPWICIILYDCIDNRGVPKGEDKGGSAPKDLIEFGEGQIIVGEGDVKNSKHTISIFAPAPQFFSLQIPLIDNGDNSFHVFSQFFCFLMQNRYFYDDIMYRYLPKTRRQVPSRSLGTCRL